VQFRSALISRGIVPPDEIIADGRIHRCDAEGKGGKGDAAYLLHTDGIPAGGFENWRDGQGWQKWRADIGRAMTPSEETVYRSRIEAARREREAEEAKRNDEARTKAEMIWNSAKPATADHPYLSRKGVKPHGLRITADGKLIVPMRDVLGVLHSLQFISADGEKRFLTGGRKRGCYFAIGKPNGALCIVEGFATAASVHESTGNAVAVAFDAGNLKSVAEALRSKLPDVKIIICADDDYRTEGNPGTTKATEAARAVGGVVAIPDFGANRPDGAKDFNDLYQAQGPEAVRACIETAQAVGEPEAVSESVKTFNYGGGRFEISPRGVFFVGKSKDGNEQAPRWICSKLSVIAKTRDAKGNEWGRLLEWKDDDGTQHQWAMPLELLQGDGSDVRRELARCGLSIAPSRAAHELLTSFLQTCPVKSRARCVERLGWHGAVFVTTNGSIGESDEIVVFQSTGAVEPAFSAAGTLADWRDSVAALSIGNSRMAFALSVAFAAALADLAGEDSGGFHLRGMSSSGKSTVLKAAASVWGHPDKYPRLWRATANGLEGLAAVHNDGLLILDELSQIDPREAGEAAYLLANGQGKTRASRTGTARQSARWRLLFLSAGEESLSAMMARAGRKPNAGQEIRLADLEADAGAGMGAFEVLHDHPSPAALALAIKDAAMRYYGTAGPEWIRCVVVNRHVLPEFIADGIRQFVEENVPENSAGQVLRVARRFGLVAVAGELATNFELTGWPKGEADHAARKCFAAWLDGFGGAGNREERAMLAQVKAFFELHGTSRFERWSDSGGHVIPNRAGFVKYHEGEAPEYFVLREAFRCEICKGFDFKTVTAALLNAGWLSKGEGSRAEQKPRLPGIGPTRCYVFTARMWEDE
jgi:uncharacterized protein (DUF927 family)/phage/plasmid primase-like uncharacterized protein